jgi:hypothetical protein
MLSYVITMPKFTQIFDEEILKEYNQKFWIYSDTPD